MKQIILQDLLASVSILFCGQRIASYSFPNHTDASNSRPCHNGASFLHMESLCLPVSQGEYRVVVRSIYSFPPIWSDEWTAGYFLTIGQLQ